MRYHDEYGRPRRSIELPHGEEFARRVLPIRALVRRIVARRDEQARQALAARIRRATQERISVSPTVRCVRAISDDCQDCTPAVVGAD